MKTIDQMTKAELKEHIKVQTRFNDKLEADYKDAIKKQQRQIEELRIELDNSESECKRNNKTLSFERQHNSSVKRDLSSEIENIINAHTTIVKSIYEAKNRYPF